MTTITLPWPSAALTPHAKGNWRAKAGATKKARRLAHWLAIEAKVKRNPNAVLRVTYHPPSLRGDVHNVHGRMKAYIDGIADAMGCDDKRFLVFFPAEFAGVRKPGEVVIEVEEE